MRLGSRRIAVVALLLAAGVHLGGVMRLDLTQDVLIQGGRVGAAEASLGDGFADLAQGTLSGVETNEVTEPVPVEQATEPVEQLEVTEPEPVQDMADDAPVEEVTDPTQVQEVSETAPPEIVVQPTETITMLDTAPVPEPTLRVTPETPVAQTPAPQQQAQRVTPVGQAPALDTLTAEEPDQLDVTQSLRPQVRSREFEERNAPDEPPPQPRETTRTATRTPSPQGNQAQTNARAGQADGSATAAPAQRATGQGAAQAGNAAVSNYPGQVMRRIQRVRRPRVGARGAATVSFRVASNGALSAVSVASSSGSHDLDRAAMQVIQRAAPFPAPPPGAQRSFRIQIEGR